MVPQWFADLPLFPRLTCLGRRMRTLGAVKLWTGHRLAWGRVSQSSVTRLGGVNKQNEGLAWGTCDKAVFCINKCKVLLYLFNNELIIENSKNYAII